MRGHPTSNSDDRPTAIQNRHEVRERLLLAWDQASKLVVEVRYDSEEADLLVVESPILDAAAGKDLCSDLACAPTSGIRLFQDILEAVRHESAKPSGITAHLGCDPAECLGQYTHTGAPWKMSARLVSSRRNSA